MKHIAVPFTIPLAILLLAACSEEKEAEAPPQPTLEQVRLAEDLTPADEALADKYDRSCRSCHSLADSGAPLTGFTPAWTPRLEARGMEGMLASTKNGFKNMPARGLCADCSDEEFTAMITFMIEGK